jgi:hypothetical protein
MLDGELLVASFSKKVLALPGTRHRFLQLAFRIFSIFRPVADHIMDIMDMLTSFPIVCEGQYCAMFHNNIPFTYWRGYYILRILSFSLSDAIF